MYQNNIKPKLDFIFSLILIFILSPLFILICVAIKLDSKGPLLFKQKRVGINKKHFNILKFRTMRIDTPKDIPTHLLTDPDKYITRVGKLLRKTSLDELPQLFNILAGHMSFIGPRPALWNQYDLIAERDKYGANNIKPGLSGLAQISGRDELPIKIKAGYDGKYVKKQSFLFDLYCLAMTIPSALNSKGFAEGKK